MCKLHCKAKSLAVRMCPRAFLPTYKTFVEEDMKKSLFLFVFKINKTWAIAYSVSCLKKKTKLR